MAEFENFISQYSHSPGDFSDALSQLLNEEVSVSSQTVSRLKKKWEEEYSDWSQRDLSTRRYVYYVYWLKKWQRIQGYELLPLMCNTIR
jgi:chemotaxis protein CheY-P-specific phosphatase CheC